MSRSGDFNQGLALKAVKFICAFLIFSVVWGVGGGNFNRRVVAYSVDNDISFNDSTGGNFKYASNKSIIEHYIQSANNKGVYIIQYQKTSSPLNGIYNINFGSSRLIGGSVELYKLSRMKKATDTQWGIFNIDEQYHLLVLTSIINNIHSGLKPDSAIPLAAGLTDVKQARTINLNELSSNDVLGVATSNYFGLIKAKGGAQGTLGNYIKATSDFITNSIRGQKFASLSIVDNTSPILSIADAVNQCKNVFVNKSISDNNILPDEIKERYKTSPLKDIFNKVSLDDFRDFDKEVYKIFYSSKGGESNQHFLLNSVGYNTLAKYSEKFSIEASQIFGLQADADLKNTKNSWAYLLELARKYSGIYQGISQQFNKDNKILLHKMVLAEYYIQKHLEYHRCIYQEMEKSGNGLPESHEYSKEQYNKEVQAFNSLSNITIDMDIGTQSDIEKGLSGSSKCGINFGAGFGWGWLAKAAENSICWTLRMMVNISLIFFNRAANFVFDAMIVNQPSTSDNAGDVKSSSEEDSDIEPAGGEGVETEPATIPGP
ncbi:MAG: hypothetical protein CEN89_167 [Candidatus Berkelbacteria bacterium Licking1014_7]|uniref:Uncharacterized protein n=1 Tax=Candidatus Berkelbacteria bacterium Licking1014_7 TaxID=2017147 RepID=A0A554LK72_9BACT|nr:MAG: hypothetical protein CEN89_167 [Candidatus Berkelbacteria bacterium Licking1014_7]